MNTKETNPAEHSKTSLPNFAEGQKLAGCYVLRRRVDAGGGVVIWLAHDQILGKDVSLHFVPPEVRSAPATMDAVRQEVKRNRQLIHPNILRVYDFVEEADWSAISMDWFEGDSLAAVLARKPAGFFEPVDIKPWIAQLCATLEDAHKVQLIHRDISPTNLFLEKSGKLLVANFGISRCVQDAVGRLRGAEDPDLGAAFMSPQQLDGERASNADDIYSFGVLLHTLLTGEAPFSGRDIVAKIRRTVPSAMAERRTQLKKSGGLIPSAWEKTVAACLEKNPEQRPKSTAEIASRLMIEKSATALESGPVLMPVAEPAPVAASGSPAPEKSAMRPIDLLRAKAKAAEGTEPPAILALPASDIPAERPLKNPERPGAEKSASPPKSEQDIIPDHYPSFEPRRSGFPLTGLAAAVILIAIGVYGTFFYTNEKAGTSGSDPEVVDRDSNEIKPVTNPLPDEPLAADFVPVAPPELTNAPPVNAAPTLAAPKPPIRVVQNTTNGTARVIPTASNPAVVTGAESGAAMTSATLEKAKQEAEAVQKLQQQMIKEQQQAEAAAADAKKLLDDRTKLAAPIQKAAVDVAGVLQKRDEEMRAAQAAADEAQRMAAEKTRLAEEAKKALVSVEADGKEKLAAQQKSDAELKTLQKALDEKLSLAAEAQKAVAEAGTRMEEQKAAIKRGEQELADAKMAAQKAAEETARMAVEKRRAVETEIEETKRLFAEKMKALEDMLNKNSAPPPPVPNSAPPSPSPTLAKPELAPPKPAAILKSPVGVVAPPEATLAMKTEPVKAVVVSPVEPKAPTAQAGLENSLGMKFVPVGDVMFSIYQTRVKDFETFAKSTGLKSNLWKDPGFKQSPEHPVVNVTWQEAMMFCKWLSAKEHKDGLLSANQAYRLPTDLEWSKAVGLPEESGKSPEARDMGVPDVYPWGNAWPPPPGAGNYTGEETGSDVAIKGYDDGYAWTSPVGSFPPSKNGLYDMGGNVWQWCMDSWNSDQKAKVLRGASWYNGALKLSLLSSCRVHASPDSSTDNYGFRCVIAAGELGKAPRKP